MYRPQDDVGSIKAGFTRNYSQDEVNALKSYVASHTGSMGSLVDRLTGAGIPLQDIATLTKAVGQASSGMPNTGVDMGGGYGGVAPTAYGTAPFHGSGSGLAALAGQVERTPRMPDNIYPDERIPRMPRDRYEDMYPPKQPIVRGGDGYPPQRPLPPTGGYSGPGGMFPAQGGDLDHPTPIIPSLPPPEYMVDPYRGNPIPGYGPHGGVSNEYDYPQPIIPSLPPSEYMVDPYSPDYNQMMPPRAPNDGISDEYYHGDPLGALMGQIQNDRVPRDQPIPIGEAMKRGGAVDISNHPTLVRMALSNRR